MGFFQKLKERFTKPKASVSLTIPKSTFGLGENLKGVIVVSSREEFDATEVRAELRCVEKVRKEKIEKKYVVNPRTHRKEWVEETREYWDIATLHSEDPRASGALHLTPRFKKEFPFKTSIPAGGRETYDGVDASVTWSIKGVVAIEGRPDVTSETMELQVITTAVEEVVMIPCEYCRSPVPETATSCPKCGAPRKT